MKNNNLLNKLFFTFSLSLFIIGCGDDEEKASAGFAGIVSSYYEEDGEVIMTVPFVNGSVSASDIMFDGSATLGEDYEILGVTDAGVEVKLFDDDKWEDRETVRMRITNASGAVNVTHEIKIVSNNCEDPVGMTIDDLLGIYTVVTDDWEDFHPGDHLTIEAVDETHVSIKEYPATSVSHKGLVLTIADFTAGGIVVESQNNGSYNASGTQTTTTTGTGEISEPCVIELTLNFSLPCCGSFNGNSLILQR